MLQDKCHSWWHTHKEHTLPQLPESLVSQLLRAECTALDCILEKGSAINFQTFSVFSSAISNRKNNQQQ